MLIQVQMNACTYTVNRMAMSREFYFWVRKVMQSTAWLNLTFPATAASGDPTFKTVNQFRFWILVNIFFGNIFTEEVIEKVGFIWQKYGQTRMPLFRIIAYPILGINVVQYFHS